METIKCPACVGAKQVMKIGMLGTRPCYQCSGKGFVDKLAATEEIKIIGQVEPYPERFGRGPEDYSKPEKQGQLKDAKKTKR